MKKDNILSQAKVYKYQHPDTGEIFTFSRRGIYKRDGKILRFIEESKSEE